MTKNSAALTLFFIAVVFLVLGLMSTPEQPTTTWPAIPTPTATVVAAATTSSDADAPRMDAAAPSAAPAPAPAPEVIVPARAEPSFTRNQREILVVAAAVRIYMESCPAFAQTGLPRVVFDRLHAVEDRFSRAVLDEVIEIQRPLMLRNLNRFCGAFVSSIPDLPLMLTLWD